MKDVVSFQDQAPLVSRLSPAESARDASQSTPPITADRVATDSRRLSQDVMLHCPQCGHKLSVDAWFCMECGSFQSGPETQVPQPITVAGLATDSHRPAEDLTVSCTQCGHQLPEDAWLCPECGSFQSEPAPKPESSYLATGTAETPPPQPITVAALRTNLRQRGPSRMTSGWQWLVSIVSRSVTTVD